MYGQPSQFNPWNGGGVTYSQNQQPAPVLNNFLTPEQIAQLQHNPTFQAKLSTDEFYRSICTHKNNNTITLEKLPNGKHRCSTCCEEFNLFDLNTSDEAVEQICNNMYDLLQSAKTYFLNAPEDLRNLYMVIGFIKKVPQLWRTAKKIFEQASNATAFGLQQNYDQNSFQILGNLFGGGMMNGMMGQNGYYYNQPTQVPPMAQYQQPWTGQPGPGPQPMQGQPQQTPYPGYNTSNGSTNYVVPAPPPPPGNQNQNMMGNPIGYVDQNASKPVNIQVPLQNANQQVSITPQPSQIVEQPTNPNIQRTDPSKTLVGQPNTSSQQK